MCFPVEVARKKDTATKAKGEPDPMIAAGHSQDKQIQNSPPIQLPPIRHNK
jgi:hypothetical protein